MHEYDFDLAVVGGGPSGVTAVLRAKELGADRVLLIERGDLGGVCTNDGCVPMRVLAKAARLMRDAHQWEAYGIHGTAPKLELPELMRRVQGVIHEMHDKKQIAARLEAAGVTLCLGQGAASFVDPHTFAVGDKRFSARNIVLCAGGHARKPPIPGVEHCHIHSDLWNLSALPKSALVIGAAATGCQAASVLRAFGTESVAIADMAPRILPGEDTFVSETVAAGFAKSGIRVLTGIQGIAKIERGPGEIRRITVTGRDGEAEVIEAELVLLCIGWAGNLDALNLSAANVEIERGYVKVDDTLRSVSARHILAAGDLNGRLMLVQTSIDSARVAVENALRGIHRKDRNRIVPHGGFTDPEYASVGLTEAAAWEAEPDCVALTVSYHEMDRPVIDGRKVGGCKIIVSRHTHHVLGAHVAGEEAMEVIHLCAGAMAGELKIDELARLELAYPTYSAVVGRAARDICRKLGLIPRAPDDAQETYVAEWEYGNK